MERHLAKFMDRVKSGRGISDEISSEYNIIRVQTADLKQSNSFTTEAGELKENIKKNRYRDILPYDQTRVLLKPLEDEYESDYINASFIQGATGNKRYIAAQGPLCQTLGDFWRMVWQHGIKVIVMACREIELGKRKCERYWAAHTETCTFGPFVISNVQELCPNEEVVIRILQAKYKDESRTLYQFQYTAWPDHGIPYTSYGILGMMDMARKVQGLDTAPILIHCSAGCGRTGVICTVDYVHDLLLSQRISEDFNIMEIVTAIRKQRPSAVQTKEQYEFVYHTVAQMFQEYLLTLCNSDRSLAEKHLPLYDNVESLNNQQPQAKSRRASSIQPQSEPSQLPQTPRPGERRMNDTYAVVNKPRQRLPRDHAPPAPSASPPVHHYDNAGLGSLSCPTKALYSTVRPKSTCAGVPAQSTASTYDQVIPSPHKGAGNSTAADHGGYEPLPGVFSTSSKNAKVADTNLIGKKSEECNSTDDDYEYVSNPIRDAGGYCSPGGMGFNCRIRKPRGPRDPPAEWGRVER